MVAILFESSPMWLATQMHKADNCKEMAMNIELTHEEKDLLCEILDRRLKELKVEIHRTDSLLYREGLDKDLVVLERLQERMSAVMAG